MIDIQLSSLDPLTRLSGTLQDKRFMKAGVKAAATHLEGAMEPYPPSTSMPGRYSLATHRPMGWYERGRGWWYPVMERRTLGAGQAVRKSRGTILASKVQRQSGAVVGYKLSLHNQSQRFQSRWSIRFEEDGLVAIIGNNTTYGHWLLGDDQASLMARIGWHKARNIALAEWPAIRALLEQNVAAYLAKRGA